MDKKVKISWEEFHKDIKKLAIKINRRKFLYQGIYGIPRGGLIVAVMLSHLTGIPVVLDKRKLGKRILVVDDIADTGKTLERFLKDKSVGAIATVWYHPKSSVVPNYYVNVKKKGWLVFPFETQNSSKIDKKNR